MPASSGFSPSEWLWHWLSSEPAFSPLTKAAGNMDTVFGFGSGDWAFHWVEEMEKATQNPGAVAAVASQAAPAQAASDSKWPHFPNGHRSLGLTPADLVRAHSWLEEASSFNGAGGWEEDDWLRYWMEQDSAFETLLRRAKEANHGWNIGQWLWLWVSQADRPQPPPAPPLDTTPPLATGMGSDAFPLSQINETVTVTQICCRSTCQDCGAGHCGVVLTREDLPHRPAVAFATKLLGGHRGKPDKCLTQHLALSFPSSISAWSALAGAVHRVLLALSRRIFPHKL